MKTKSRPAKAAAVLTIRDASKMTPRGRQDIAAWLQMSAKGLIKHGKKYDGTFRARYLYARP